MFEAKYPFKSWVLTPGFAPKEVELVGAAYYSGYHTTTTGKTYHQSDLFPSKREAIESGWRRLGEQQAALQRRADAIVKKKAMLTKHSAGL